MRKHKSLCLRFLCTCKPEDRYSGTVMICPYCGSETSGPCCGENHQEEHYVKYRSPKKHFSHWQPYDFVNPRTGKIHDEPNDETRVSA